MRGTTSQIAFALLEIIAAFVPFVALGAVSYAAGLDSALGLSSAILAPVLSVGVATLVLRRKNTGWREIGLARPKSWLRTTVLALATFVGAVFVIVLVQVVAQNIPGLVAESIDESRFDALEGSVIFLVISLLGAWTTISFGEEMLFRAFLISRVTGIFQNYRVGAIVAVGIAGVVFGVTHVIEGPVGILSNGAFGVLFGVIYLRTGRNLWVTIIAHGGLNTVRFVLVFAGAT
ncbi:MAG: CPBP family intramembrane metalloprotease [SAR202 cluster bacterium]|nr:CPBP family intramembrane metalloprotease [SAR202 cluster bacterium]